MGSRSIFLCLYLVLAVKNFALIGFAGTFWANIEAYNPGWWMAVSCCRGQGGKTDSESHLDQKQLRRALTPYLVAPLGLRALAHTHF